MKVAKDMTDEELRVAVAELCGFEHVSQYQDSDCMGESVECVGMMNGVRKEVPNYPKDLNAMHEAELYLQKEAGPMAWLDYVDVLRREAMGWGGAGAEVSATARERAEAFLEVMRKKL